MEKSNMINDDKYWQAKTSAFLSGPPQSVFLPFNEINEIGRDLANAADLGAKDSFLKKAALLISGKSDSENYVKQAKDFLKGYEPLADERSRNNYKYDGNLYLSHPLSGEMNKIKLKVEPQELNDKVSEIVKKLTADADSVSDKFLRLWEKFQAELIAELPHIPWAVLPANPIIPDHSIWTKSSLLSAVAGIFAIGKTPGMMMVSLGPVQDFISAARKTADLWAGSYILSVLVETAANTIADELGPDCLIFPSPRVKRHESGGTAIYPNRILALVPIESYKKLAERITTKAADKWGQLTDAAIKYLPINTEAKKIAVEQIKNHLEHFIVAAPLPSLAEKSEWLENYFKLTFQDNKALDGYKNRSEVPYELFYNYLDRLMFSRKLKRDHSYKGTPGDGPRCSLCGKNAVVLRAEDVNSHLVDKRDRLCGVCATKRMAPLKCGDVIPKQDFPSTSTMATAAWKADIIERIDKNDELKEVVIAYCEKIEEFLKTAKQNITAAYPDGLTRLAEKKLNDTKKAGDFFKIDGRWLFKESFDEYDRMDLVAVLERLIGKAEKTGVGKPPIYYGLLLMDGDDIGKWLRGSKPDTWRRPTVNNIMHPDFRLGSSEIRPFTILNHYSLSEALSGFTAEAIKIIKSYQGAAVYAGGDDLLAFFPVKHVIESASKLRAAFGGVDETELITESKWAEGVLAMGALASASSAIMVAHHLQPLGQVLSSTRDLLESEAKRVGGKNAFAVGAIVRSGTRMSFAQPFITEYGDASFFGLKIFEDVVNHLSNGTLSDRLIYNLKRAAPLYANAGHQTIVNEVERLAKRQENKTQESIRAITRLANYASRSSKGKKIEYDPAIFMPSNGRLSAFIRMASVANFVARYVSGDGS